MLLIIFYCGLFICNNNYIICLAFFSISYITFIIYNETIITVFS